MPPYVTVIIAVVVGLVCAVVGFVLGYQRRKAAAEREIGSAEEEARRIINDAIKSAESKKREATVEAKEEKMSPPASLSWTRSTRSWRA